METIVILGGKVVELHHPEVGLGGDLHGVKVGASAGKEQMLGKFFILQRAVPITRNILTIYIKTFTQFT